MTDIEINNTKYKDYLFGTTPESNGGDFGIIRCSDLDHAELEEKLIELYEENTQFTIKTAPEYNKNLMRSPDIILLPDGPYEKDVALEIKTNFGGFVRAFYQTRCYALDRLSPYIIMCEEVYEFLEEEIARVMNYTPVNSPGIAVISLYSIDVEYVPRYE
jgi:hypothetical protein